MSLLHLLYLFLKPHLFSPFFSSFLCIHLRYLRTDISGIDQASIFSKCLRMYNFFRHYKSPPLSNCTSFTFTSSCIIAISFQMEHNVNVHFIMNFFNLNYTNSINKTSRRMSTWFYLYFRVLNLINPFIEWFIVYIMVCEHCGDEFKSKFSRSRHN
jgi:hypothetical protein